MIMNFITSSTILSVIIHLYFLFYIIPILYLIHKSNHLDSEKEDNDIELSPI